MRDAMIPCLWDQPWQRHELVCVASKFWSATLASKPMLAAIPYLPTWADRGWPLVVRRRMADDRPGWVPVGVPLPPSTGKQRIALAIPTEAVVERWPPPLLWTIRHAADSAWESTIHALVILGARHAIAPAAFGSLLWQHQTGLCYLSSRSDLDVLWRAHPGCEVGSLLAGVAAIERIAPMRIDGEVVFPDGNAVNWRELYLALNQDNHAEVLIKSIEGVRLVQVGHLRSRQKAA